MYFWVKLINLEFDLIISFIVATAILACSPGPDNIYVLIQSITHGKQYGLATVAGLITGCLIHTTLVAFGVSTLIKQSDTLFNTIKVLGALYLFYLAYKVLIGDSRISLENNTVPKRSLKQLFKQGFIMNVLNPKVSIFFLALFPGFLFSDTISTVVQFYILGLIFMAVSLVIFSAIAILSGIISDAIKQYKNVGAILKWLQVVVFVAIGVFILFSEK